MPDDELLAAAESGRLRKPAVLKGASRAHDARPEGEGAAENFAGQWLQLRNLDEASRTPTASPILMTNSACMKRETELFFEAVVKEDRSILDFLDAKFTYLNDRLADTTEFPGVEGSEFRRVALTGDQRAAS